MNKKGLLIGLIIAVILALIAAFAFAKMEKGKEAVNESEYYEDDTEAILSGDDNPNPEEEEEEGNGIFFEEEMDDAEIVKAESKESDFYGTWEATSDMALYLYGNFELTIEPGGVWHGNITDEKMDGKWRMEGSEMHVVNEWIDVSLVFTEDGTLVMQRNAADEDEEEEIINTVMVRK